MNDLLTVQADPKELDRLGRALSLYSANSKRTPAKLIADCTSKLLLGDNIDGTGGHIEGLFDRLYSATPASGAISIARKADHYRLGRPTSTSISMARARVNSMLGRGESGAFKNVVGKKGSKWVLGTVYSKRRGRIGYINFRARGAQRKNARVAIGLEHARIRAEWSGGVLLNRQAATVAFALSRREASRFASAAQFLPKRYRRTIRQIAGLTYKSGNALGISSADSYRFHHHVTGLVANAKGTALGTLEFDATERGASVLIRGNLGLHTDRQRTALNASIRMVSDYAIRRLAERLPLDSADAMRLAQIAQL